MNTPEYAPFNKLALPPGEVLAWHASDRTFHRTSGFGIAVTNIALYVYSPFWLYLARWRRVPFSSISWVKFHDSIICPSIRVKTGRKVVVLRTPWDSREEMDFDRSCLVEATRQVSSRLPAQPASNA